MKRSLELQTSRGCLLLNLRIWRPVCKLILESLVSSSRKSELYSAGLRRKHQHVSEQGGRLMADSSYCRLLSLERVCLTYRGTLNTGQSAGKIWAWRGHQETLTSSRVPCPPRRHATARSSTCSSELMLRTGKEAAREIRGVHVEQVQDGFC